MKKIIFCLAIILLSASTLEAITEIYCPSTRELAYYYLGDLFAPVETFKDKPFLQEDFLNLDGTPVHGKSVCPKTEVPINGFEWWFYKRGYNIPKIVYNSGYTFLTKDEEGNFVWKPYDLNISEQ